MAKVVKLNVLQNNDKEETIDHVISAARVFQYTDLAKLLGNLLTRVKNDEALLETVQVQFFGNVDKNWIDKDTEQLLPDIKKQLETNSMEAIAFALEHLPEELVTFIAVLSRLEKDTVQRLDDESLFELLDAIVAENDIERLVKMGKKFFDSLQNHWFKKESQKKQQANLQNVTK